MMKLSRESADCWRTSDQMAYSQKMHVRKVISDRLAFIYTSILTWSKANLVLSPFKLLDAGCGDGVLLKHLSDNRWLECYGMDANIARVDKARENAPKAKSVVYGDLLDVHEWRKGWFDVVILSQVLEHVPDDNTVLNNIVDTMKLGGLLIVGVPNEGCILAVLRNRWLEPSISRNTDHVHFYSESKIKSKLRLSGFTIMDVMRENFMYPRQEISRLLTASSAGYRLSQLLGRVFKSQAAGLYFACWKENDE